MASLPPVPQGIPDVTPDVTPDSPVTGESSIATPSRSEILRGYEEEDSILASGSTVEPVPSGSNPWSGDQSEYDKYFRSPSSEETGGSSSGSLSNTKGDGDSVSSSETIRPIDNSSAFNNPEIVVIGPSAPTSPIESNRFSWNNPTS